MDIKEIKFLKKELEHEITVLCDKFEKETMCDICSLYLDKDMMMPDYHIGGVRVGVML